MISMPCGRWWSQLTSSSANVAICGEPSGLTGRTISSAHLLKQLQRAQFGQRVVSGLDRDSDASWRLRISRPSLANRERGTGRAAEQRSRDKPRPDQGKKRRINRAALPEHLFPRPCHDFEPESNGLARAATAQCHVIGEETSHTNPPGGRNGFAEMPRAVPDAGNCRPLAHRHSAFLSRKGTYLVGWMPVRWLTSRSRTPVQRPAGRVGSAVLVTTNFIVGALHRPRQSLRPSGAEVVSSDLWNMGPHVFGRHSRGVHRNRALARLGG